jgi:hypothetical protein
LPIAAVVVLSTGASLLIALPVMIASVRISLETAGFALVAGVCAIVIAVTAALATLVAVARIAGHERASQIVGGLSIPLVVLTVWGFRAAVRSTDVQIALLVMLVGAIASWPALSRFAIVGVVNLMGGGDMPRRSPEPHWGQPSWGRQFLRTNGPWAIAGAVPIAVASIVYATSLRRGLTAIVLLSLVLTTLSHLWRPEYDCKDRWKLAPEGWRMRRSLLLRAGGAAVGPAIAVALGLGASHPIWAGAVVLLLAAAPATFLIPVSLVRGAAQAVLLGAALLTQAL